MSRVAKWKLEKAKVKVVFRLQFHATHIPQVGWDKLFISFIPADTGKATGKTTKANVRNGACKWADPIYETTRLLQDSKSKHYDEKLYKFVVAMGSSRSGILGEATINLADYADALKPSIVALPLQGCSSGTILHVTVQLLTSKTGFREFEQQRELRERGLQTGTDPSRHDACGTGKISSSEEVGSDQIDKVNSRVRFRTESKELPSLEEEAGLNEDYADSALGFDGLSNNSESLYGEKHEVSSTHEIDSQKSTVSDVLRGLPNCQSPLEEKGDTSDSRILALRSSDWVHSWSSDCSMDNDMAIAYEENNKLRGSLEVAESSILELKLEVSSLQSHADEIGAEAKKFSQQLANEIASGEELAKDVSAMKAECSKLKGDIEQLKSLKASTQYANRETNSVSGCNLFQGIQVRLLNGLFILEDKIRELQNKVYLGFHDSDLRLLYTDLEALTIVVKEIKQGAEEANSLLNLPSEMINVKESREVISHGNEQFVAGQGLDVDLYQPPDMLHCLSIPNIVSQGPDSLGAMDAMKGKIFELLRELDEAKAERESLTRKMDQMECYYEALVQELEENQKQMLGELQNLRNEHSTSLYTIATTNTEMESMRQDLNEQVLRFSEERRELESVNKELERRALTSEAALRRARLNYSIAVDQLQKDLDLLSFQVLSMFETNEGLIKQTFSEHSQHCLQGHPDGVRSLEECDGTKLWQLQNQNAGANKLVISGDILLEDMKKSLLLQEGLYQKVEEELSEMQVVNVSLDVFSKILQETLVEASLDIILLKKKTDELDQQLDLAAESKKLLILQLQTALDEVQTLTDYKAKCSDMAQQNQLLEANLESLSNENVLLMQKAAELEALMMEFRSYESKYEACSIEKTETTNLLKQEALNKENLQNEMFLLKEELKIVKAEHSELASLKENLQEIVNLLEDKLRSLLSSYNKQFNGLFPPTNSLYQDWGSNNLKGVVLQLEEIQHNACEKIFQLLEEKKSIEDERDLAYISSSTANAEILVAKQKFKHDIQRMVDKLESSNSLVAKLQLKLEALADKLHICSEAEERYTQQNEELLADLSVLEIELQQLSKNMDLAKEMMSLDSINEELGRSKLTIAELTEGRQNLRMSLLDKSEESVKLASELDGLKESMRFLHDELHVERSFRENLESSVTDLVSQLNEKHDRLLQFSQQETELLHFRQLVSDLELEKSKICHILLQREECLEKLHEESSCLTDLENQLSEMHEHVVAADVKGIFIGTEYETRIEKLVLKLQSSERDVVELRRKLVDIERKLNHSLAGEAQYVQENVNLQKSIESLRSELEASVAQHDVLSDLNHHMSLKIEEYKKRIADLELNFSSDKTEHNLEVEKLKNMLNHSLAGEAHYVEENVNLQKSTESLRSELEASVAQQGILSDLNSCLTLQVEEYKKQIAELELNLSNDKTEHSLEVEQLKNMLNNSLAGEAHYVEENVNLQKSVESLRSELEASVAQQGVLSDLNSHLTLQMEEYKKQIAELELSLSNDKTEHSLELEQLKNMLNHSLAGEAHYVEKNVNLQKSFKSLSSELEASVARQGVLSELNNHMTLQMEEYKKRIAELELNLSNDKTEHSLVVKQLKCMLSLSGEEIDNLISSKEEIEITLIVLKAKLVDLLAHIISLEKYNEEILTLQNQCHELTRKLSEQILKTEEFKNLSIHLRELKDKAEGESLQAREKREPEGPPIAAQESLRIAFIKEQCETRVQELKHQLSISQKHGEELLWKLQDAVDELENRKKSEASNLKRNEELSVKILELEAELQSVVSEKREKTKACDRIKAELECAQLSFECCKEEKQRLEVSLLECSEENNRIATELILIKGQLESSVSPVNIQNKESNGSDDQRHLSGNRFVEQDYKDYKVPDPSIPESVTMEIARNGSTERSSECSAQKALVNCEEGTSSSPIDDFEQQTLSVNVQPLQDVLVPKVMHALTKHASVGQEALLHNDLTYLSVINDHFRNQSLRSTMDHLQKELEKMKNENSLIPMDDLHVDPNFQGLQTDLMQLHKANEELRSIFPLFNEIPDSGNALERVLALEIELAEALRAKKKSSGLFQSSFLKQHGDEQAIFQSFRDINELIKEILELKGRYAAVESELKDMHDRYSQLSLQFAEVEGERQKLTMTLKSVRSMSNKSMHLNHSP